MGANASKSEETDTDEVKDMTRDDIKFVVNNIGQNLQQLGQELQIDSIQLKELEQSNDSIEEKTCMMLGIWIGKEGKNATKEAMMDALRQIERSDMADHLKNIEHETELAFSKLHQFLMNLYSELNIPQPPFILHKISIDEIFMEPEIEIIVNQSKEKTKAEQFISELVILSPNLIDKLVPDSVTELSPESVSAIIGLQHTQLEDLFQPLNEQPVKRILVEGVGKTPLVYKLARDWANGEEYIASKFNLLMLIPLREVKEGKLEDVILQIIHTAVGNEVLTIRDLKSFLSQHKMLLLLDGYDDMSVECKKQLTDLLENKKLESIWILLTNQQGIYANDKQNEEDVQREFWDKKIKLKGVTQPQQKQVLLEHLKNDDAVIAMQSIYKLFYGIDNGMFQSVSFVFWLDRLLEKNPGKQFETKTAFYKALVNVIFHKTLVLKGKIEETDTLDIFVSTNNVETLTLKKEIQHIGKLAHEQLIDQNVSFTEKELTQDFSEGLLIESDLFVKYTSLTQEEEETYFKPMHKSFLEFLVALSISYAVENEEMSFGEFTKTIGNMVSQGKGPSLSSLFFPFLAQLMGQRAHWLFESLSPWSAIYNLCQTEMLNVLVEISDSNDDIIQSLVKFIPQYYVISPLTYMSKRYYSSEFHNKLFQLSVKRKLISHLFWDLSILESLPVEYLQVDRLSLAPSINNFCVLPTKTSIQCNELVFFIDKNMTSNSWVLYLFVFENIKTQKIHLCLSSISVSTFEMIFDELQHLFFHRVQLLIIPPEDIYLKFLVQCVKNNRIKTGIYLYLNKQNKITVSSVAISQLWEAVLQSPSIVEFSLWNYNEYLHPIFEFTLDSDVIRKIPFQMIHLSGHFMVALSGPSCCVESIQELLINNESCPDSKLTNLLRNVCHVDYFQCFEHLLSSSVSSNLPLVSSLTELYLTISKDVSFSFPSSVVEQLTSLQKLSVDTENLYFESIPESVDEFLVAMLNFHKLRYLGFRHVQSSDVVTGLMKIMSKIEPVFKLFCFELCFSNKMKFNLSPSSLNPVKELLRQKQLNHVSIMDIYSSATLRSVLLVMFSVDEFQFKCEITGTKDEHCTSNRLDYERFLKTINCFRIELIN